MIDGYQFDRVRFYEQPIEGKYYYFTAMHLATTNLRVTDPCYSLNTWCAYSIKNMKLGTYDGLVDIIGEGRWGNRVASIAIVHRDFVSKYKHDMWVKNKDAHIGVDSGQAGFFAQEEYSKFFDGEDKTPLFDQFYELCGEQTLGKYYKTVDGFYLKKPSVAGSLPLFGFLSQSGYGDGGYNLYTIEENGETVAAKIVFIGDEEDEEVENEE